MNNEMLEVLLRNSASAKNLAHVTIFHGSPGTTTPTGFCGKAWPWHERIVQLNHHAGLNSSVLTLSKLHHKIRQSGFFSLMPVLFKTAC